MAQPKDPSYTPPAGATLNEEGMWIMADGDFAPGQNMGFQQNGATPAQASGQMGAPQIEPGTNKPFRIISGQKWYIPPMDSTSGMGGGGLIHGSQQWNPQTGAFDTPLDWGKILSMVAAGIITAGVVDVALSSSPALAATAGPEASTEAATAEATGAVPASTAGVEGGATAGLDPSVAAGLPGASPAMPLASTTLPTATGTVAGSAGSTSAIPAATDGSSLATAGGASTPSLSKIASLAKDTTSLGTAISNAASGAGNSRRADSDTAVLANNSNITGQADFENELMNRSKVESAERQGSLADVYRQSYSTSDAAGTGPKVGPNNKAGSPVFSPAYLKALSDLSSQGATKLAKPAQYDTDNITPLKPYTPITAPPPSVGETIGSIAGPVVSGLGSVAKLWQDWNNS